MSISSVSSAGLAILTKASTGILSNLPAGLSAADLSKASAQDVAELSIAATQSLGLSTLFGDQTGSVNGAPSLPQLESLLTSATPAQKTTYAETVAEAPTTSLLTQTTDNLLQVFYQTQQTPATGSFSFLG
jgi:hypothetical protein